MRRNFCEKGCCSTGMLDGTVAISCLMSILRMPGLSPWEAAPVILKPMIAFLLRSPPAVECDGYLFRERRDTLDRLQVRKRTVSPYVGGHCIDLVPTIDNAVATPPDTKSLNRAGRLSFDSMLMKLGREIMPRSNLVGFERTGLSLV